MNSLSTVDNAIDLLMALSTASKPQGVTALSSALGLGKSSTHRLLASLARRGLVEQDERRRYQTGPALVALGPTPRDDGGPRPGAAPLVSLAADLRAEAPSSSYLFEPEWLFYDGTGHWNEKGNAIGAATLHAFLTRPGEGGTPLANEIAAARQ